jgi:hypothetical protein
MDGLDHQLEFSAKPIAPEKREELLAAAADIFDRRAATLGGGPAPETPEGRLAREFSTDRAELGRPEVHRLASGRIERAGVPVTGDELNRLAAHHWLSLPVSLWTRSGHAFNRLEIKLIFNEGDSDGRPVVVDAVPTHELVTKFETSAKLAVSVNGNFKLKVQLPDASFAPLGVPAEIGGGAGVDAEAESKIILGPFGYSIRSPEVQRSGLGFPEVWWRLERSSFLEENDPGLRVILMTPRTTARLRVGARLLATRYTTFFGAGFRHALWDLPAVMRQFFTGGTPIAAAGEWDLSGAL